MSNQFPPIPAGSTIRQNADGSWQYRSTSGPWCDMAAPQKTAPWAMPTPPKPPATVAPTLCDCIALAVCPDRTTGAPCEAQCDGCRRDSAAVAHEIAAWLHKRHGGSSTDADLLDGVGAHRPEPQAGWPPIDPGKEAMALAVVRDLRRPNV